MNETSDSYGWADLSSIHQKMRQLTCSGVVFAFAALSAEADVASLSTSELAAGHMGGQFGSKTFAHLNLKLYSWAALRGSKAKITDGKSDSGDAKLSIKTKNSGLDLTVSIGSWDLLLRVDVVRHPAAAGEFQKKQKEMIYKIFFSFIANRAPKSPQIGLQNFEETNDLVGDRTLMVVVDLLESAEPRGVAVEDLEDGLAPDSAFFKDRQYLEKEWGHFFSDDLFSSEGKVLFEGFLYGSGGFGCGIIGQGIANLIMNS
ncbi:hypothetical protein Ddye_016594 [Dipteronia dyeriana]|uniref:Uncharacterized protein n=1 Tax=Dipteronia dyeriana TaxID=168575 RepID=A0AAD9U7Y2_9ROSI|nr:hypothetical protein Ddye_016594 [Dipteronia dyeriana]